MRSRITHRETSLVTDREKARIRKDFRADAAMPPARRERWLETSDSEQVG